MAKGACDPVDVTPSTPSLMTSIAPPCTDRSAGSEWRPSQESCAARRSDCRDTGNNCAVEHRANRGAQLPLSLRINHQTQGVAPNRTFERNEVSQRLARVDRSMFRFKCPVCSVHQLEILKCLQYISRSLRPPIPPPQRRPVDAVETCLAPDPRVRGWRDCPNAKTDQRDMETQRHGRDSQQERLPRRGRQSV